MQAPFSPVIVDRGSIVELTGQTCPARRSTVVAGERTLALIMWEAP